MSRPRRRAAAVLAACLLAGCTTDADPAAPPVAGPEVLAERPAVVAPEGEPPTDLVVEDLVVGTGEPPSAGDLVATRFVGVGFGSGAEFDASWDRGEPLQFRVGTGAVIPGWDLGILGDEERGIVPMLPGGRRRLTIPPGLAYGDVLQPGLSDPADTTLVFVVDLLAARPETTP